MNLQEIYLNLPAWLQNVAVSLEGRRIARARYAPEFDRLLDEYEKRTLFNRDALAAFRDRRLERFVQHAVETVPYYRELFPRLGMDFHGITRLEDLAQLPILTKAEVQDAPDRFRSEAFAKKDLLMCHTSGSTGAGLRFPTTWRAHREQWAVWWRYRKWHGLSRDAVCLYFGGRLVVPIRRQKPPFWRYNRPGRQVLFSAYHLSPATARDYLAEMHRWPGAWIHGYPSLVALIAQFALEHREPLDIRWVTTGAESLLPHQRSVIQRAFGVAPVEHYGMAEAAANISQCPRGRLHVDEDFAAVEFVPGAAGGCRVIGTNFSNPAFPLLRYDVGDLVTPADSPCDCGRGGRVVEKIDGRIEDCVITKSGACLGRLDHIFKDALNIRAAQIRQSQAGRMVIHVVKGPHYGQRDEQLLTAETKKRVGDQVDFKIVYAENLPRTGSGKLRFVVSSVGSAEHRAA